MPEKEQSTPEQTVEESVMNSLKANILSINSVLERAAKNNINIEITMKTSTRPEYNVPYVQFTLNAANKQLYTPLIIQPR